MIKKDRYPLGEPEFATAADADEMLALYRSALSDEMCTWDEYYPCRETIEFDLKRKALLIWRDEDGRIISAISIDDDEEVKSLTCWNPKLEPAGELSRVIVRNDLRNRGIAPQMMRYAFEELKKRGFAGVHILVYEKNLKALRAYASLGYKEVGNCRLFDRDFLCFERKLEEE